MKPSVPRIVMLGTTSVGKTSLINRIVYSKFDANAPPTTGAGFFQYKSPPPEEREIQIWDTAGMERFRSLNNVYYQRAVGAILVFDLTNLDSFKELDSWRDEFISKTSPNAIIILVGNKSDLEDQIEVDKNDIDQYCSQHGLKYYETSACTGHNVTNVITELISMLPPSEDNVVSSPLEEKKGGCC